MGIASAGQLGCRARPFMVERGHFDGVAPDEAVAYEFAKVFHLPVRPSLLPADFLYKIAFLVSLTK